MFAMPLSAQVASYTYIDQKAPYKNPGWPLLTALNLPKVGTTFKVRVPTVWQCGPVWTGGGATFYLAFGVSNPNVSIPGMGGFLFTSAEIVLLLRPGNCPNNGTVTMSFLIPNSPGLLGVPFYQQVLAEQHGEFVPNTYYLSRGGYGVIGK